MDPRTRRDLPARLAALRRRLEDWRTAHQPRSRIPEALWRSAGRAAGVYGLHRTARALRLDYYALKKWVERETAEPDRLGTAPAADADANGLTPFLELVPPLASVSECIVELENTAGAKMRIELKGSSSPDLAALSRSFWNPQP